MDWLFGLFLMVIGQAGVLTMCDVCKRPEWSDWVVDAIASLSLAVHGIGLYVFLNNGL